MDEGKESSELALNPTEEIKLRDELNMLLLKSSEPSPSPLLGEFKWIKQ